MKIDKISQVSFAVSAGGYFSANYTQGKVTHVLVTTNSGFLPNETVSVKLRTKRTVHLIADKVPTLVLETLTNYRYGQVFGGWVAGVHTLFHDLHTKNAAAFSYDGIVNGVLSFPTKKPFAVMIPLGHLTLAGDSELEVTFECKAQEGAGSRKVQAYAVHDKNAPDHILVHDTTGDSDSSQSNVREVFGYSRSGSFVTAAGAYKEINYELQTRDFSTSAEIESYLISTQLFGSFEVPSASNMVSLVSFKEALPENNVRVKAIGADQADNMFIFIKESMLKQTSDSTKSQVVELKRKVEEIEKESPSDAKEYRHAGIIPKSSDLADAIQVIEAGERREEKTV